MTRKAEKMTECDGKMTKEDCGGCPICSRRDMKPVPPDAITGLKLVICAFLVFVAPFIAAVFVGDVLLHRYHQSAVISTVAAIITGVFTVILVRLLTSRIGKSEQKINSEQNIE